MISLRDVLLTRGDAKFSFDFEAAKGERVAIMGPSGSGKSTLLDCIAGFVPVESGSLVLDGQNHRATDPAKRPVASLFQTGNCFDHLSVMKNVVLGRTTALWPSKEDQEAAHRAIEKVGLKGFEERRPTSLSGGQQQRVALARILLTRRPIITLDEPFSALDQALREEINDLVVTLAAELDATVLMVTHDQNDANRFADRVLVMKSENAIKTIGT